MRRVTGSLVYISDFLSSEKAVDLARQAADHAKVMSDPQLRATVPNATLKRGRLVRELAAAERAADRCRTSVEHWEGVLDITEAERWNKSTPEYEKTADYIRNKKFVRAAEAVRGAVISRMMELEKLHACGISAYRLLLSCSLSRLN